MFLNSRTTPVNPIPASGTAGLIADLLHLLRVQHWAGTDREALSGIKSEKWIVGNPCFPRRREGLRQEHHKSWSTGAAGCPTAPHLPALTTSAMALCKGESQSRGISADNDLPQWLSVRARATWNAKGELHLQICCAFCSRLWWKLLPLPTAKSTRIFFFF